eukprot:2234342-Ditylum_brightwellii.AAC.1
MASKDVLSKPVNASYTDDNDLMPWPEHMDPEVSQLIEEETKAKEADAMKKNQRLRRQMLMKKKMKW